VGFGKVSCRIYYDKEDADNYVKDRLSKKGVHVTMLPYEHEPFCCVETVDVDEIDDTDCAAAAVDVDKTTYHAWLVVVKKWAGAYWVGGFMFEKHEDAIARSPRDMSGIIRHQIEFTLCSDSKTLGRTPPPSPRPSMFK
jgi:hypothetical protein